MNKLLAGLGQTGRVIVVSTFVLFVAAGIAQAATTISTNISTAGTLSVTDQTTLGNATSTIFSAYSAYFGGSATSTFSTAGALTLITPLAIASGGTGTTTSFYGGILFSDGTVYRQASTTALLQWNPTTQVFTTNNASTTQVSIAGSLWVNGNATTTSAGALSLQSTLGVLGLTSLASASTTGSVSVAGNLWVNGNATTTSAGALALQSTLDVIGNTTLASTTATSFKVGQTGSQLTRAVANYCVTASSDITASTTTMLTCTPATGTPTLTAADRVFVMATSSLPGRIHISAASSTAAGTIQVNVFNTGIDGGAPGAAVYAFNFWTFQ